MTLTTPIIDRSARHRRLVDDIRVAHFSRGTTSSSPAPSSRQSVSLWVSPRFPAKRGFSAGLQAAWGGAVGRDAQSPATSRQGPVGSLPGLYSSTAVPATRSATLAAPAASRVRAGPGVSARGRSCEFGAGQTNPSTVRCSCQASGRRECASSLSAVRSRGWRPSRIA